MGYCHSVIESDGVILGDVLDIEMMKASPFDLGSK